MLFRSAAFCLENDTVATALLGYLATVESFTGTAADLQPLLIAIDSELTDRLSAKRLGKRITALWPHLANVLAVARREKDRKGVFHFTFSSVGGFAGF